MIDSSKLWMVNADDYHNDFSADSHSSIQLFRQSRERYAAIRIHRSLEPDAPTPAMTMGALTHCLILEPKELGSRYIIHPGFDRRTREGKSQAATFDNLARGKTIVTMEDAKKASAMREGVMRNPHARAALEDEGISEASITWTCPDTGCPLKCRMDRLHHSGLIVDLKTCEDISPEGFGRNVVGFSYYRQAALYMDGANTALGVDAPFLFLAVSKTPPHECAAYLLDDRALALGRDDNRRTLIELSECRASGDWSGRWSNVIQNLGMPAWAFTRMA